MRRGSTTPMGKCARSAHSGRTAIAGVVIWSSSGRVGLIRKSLDALPALGHLPLWPARIAGDYACRTLRVRRGFRNSYRLTGRCAAEVPSVAKFRVATIRSEPAVTSVDSAFIWPP